jgi:RHS repeat-associated protein
MGYDALGRRNRLTRPNGTATTTTYDTAGRTTGTVTTDALDSVVHQILTTYDARGLPDTQTDQEGLHDYQHDERARLTGVDHPAGAEFSDESYRYDSADRRTSSHRDPASEVVFNNADQLVQDATYAYVYDDEGRQVSRTHRVTTELTTYTYNALDQMVALSMDSGIEWSFGYDARDLRVLVKSAVGGVEAYGEAFVYDGNGTVRASYDTSGVKTASYLAAFGFGEVLGRDEAGSAGFALRDRLGTTVGWLDQAGGVGSLTARDAYGVRAVPSKVVPFGYTGHAEDPTGLVWGRARYYAASTGSWKSEDPDATQPRYGYAEGIPSAIRDPSGRGAAIEFSLIETAFLLTSYCAIAAGAAVIYTIDNREPEMDPLAAVDGSTPTIARSCIYATALPPTSAYWGILLTILGVTDGIVNSGG